MAAWDFLARVFGRSTCTFTNPGVSASPGCAVEGEGMATVAELEAKLTSGEAGKLPEAGQ